MNQIDQYQKNRHVYIVLGMARSGTSAITRGFKVLGIQLGDHLIDRTDDWNPKGVWEDAEVVYKINRNIVYLIDNRWMHGDYDEISQQYPALNEYKLHAVQLLNDRLSVNHNWGLKDPRMVKLMPFWREVFHEASVNEHYVIALRHPLAVAASNQPFSKLDLELSIIEWVETYISIIDETVGKQRIVVAYDEMLDNPKKQLQRIYERFDSLEVLQPNEMEIYANRFLDKKLRHHAVTEQALGAGSALNVAPLAVQIYDLLIRVARDELALDGDAFIVEWNAIKSEYARQLPIYQYVNKLHQSNLKLTRELRTIRRSVPWKLSYPLRLVDDKLRLRRQRKRAKRKHLKLVSSTTLLDVQKG